MSFDLLVKNGLVFDGLGSAPVRATVAVRDGSVVAIEPGDALRDAEARETIDAGGAWVVPGFIDLHTHYDAEIEVAPSLSESLKHGVTSVVVGSCSLSLALGDADELADMYCRVEALPDDLVRPLLRRVKDWDGHRSYFAHLASLPLGPHVASFVGHSAIRAHVMGIERSLDADVQATPEELQRMRALLEEGLDEGYLGLSVQTLPWDKMGGTRDYRSRPLPSTFAPWSEVKALVRTVRERERVFQGVPNVSTKWNVLRFMRESIPWETLGLGRRKPLKTTVISMMDLVGSRGIHHLIGALSSFVNRVLGGDFRWQALPEPFDLWADGLELVVFEEFGAGARALHEADPKARSALARDPSYRRWFKDQWQNPFLPKAFHRNLSLARVLSAPDASLAGRTFTEIGDARGTNAVEAFLDLVARFGSALRWTTVMANDREEELETIMAHPDVLIGFSDAGAHLRQMAHYSFPLRMLLRVREAQARGAPFMTAERAVERLTSEIARWLGVDAGVLAPGRRADLVVIDDARLSRDALESVALAPMEGFGGFERLVRSDGGAVRAVVVNGRVAAENGALRPEVGRERGFGGVLRAR